MFKLSCVTLLLISALACGSNASPTAPASVPPRQPAPIHPTSSFHLTGIATDDDGSPVTGATITVQPVLSPGVPPVSLTTDGRGSYSIDFTANSDGFYIATVKGEHSGNDPSYQSVSTPAGTQNAVQNVHLYRVTRITAGESIVLTILPGDTICGDNDQFMCRAVHIVVPTSGTLTIAAVATPSATNAGLEVSGFGPAHLCCGLFASIPVTAGTEVVASVGAWWTSTASQSFVFNTSLLTP